MLRSVFIAIAAVSCAIVSQAQLTRGVILGSVQDPTGAVISSATVRIVNSATQTERTTISSGDGLFRFDGVDPGVYDVVFVAKGFAETRVPGVTVRTSQEVTLNQQLAVSSTSTVVDVTDNPPGVELDKSTATIQRTLSQSFIDNVATT